MKIKIDFDGFWGGFNKYDNYFINLLKTRFNLCIDENTPDYIIYSCFKSNICFTKRTGVKIFFTGENLRVDFNFFDYGIGFDHLEFGDRYIRWPLYLSSGGENMGGPIFKNILNKRKTPSNILKEKTGFCSFIFSNSGANPIRELFFRRLSKYKTVDSGGRFLNNIGGPVDSKLNFINKYKFNIAFENSCMPGYTTEKLVEAMAANTIPIYWGDPYVTKDFNPESFIRVKNNLDIDTAIDQIIKLDQDDQLYMEMMGHQWVLPENEQTLNTNKLLDFFENIFKQGPINASRISKYEYNKKVWLKRYHKDKNRFKLLSKR